MPKPLACLPKPFSAAVAPSASIILTTTSTPIAGTSCMAPPKKGRASAAASGASSAPSAPVPDLSSGIAFELHVGEKDNANLVFIERIASAWELIHDHHVFAGIQTELPLGITGSHDDCGTQRPFDSPPYQKKQCPTQALTRQA